MLDVPSYALHSRLCGIVKCNAASKQGEKVRGFGPRAVTIYNFCLSFLTLIDSQLPGVVRLFYQLCTLRSTLAPDSVVIESVGAVEL